jgi:hypothetical protein
MTTVINNNKLSTLEKINLYSKILKKNFVIEARLKNKNVQSIPTTKESTPVKMEQELKEEPTDDSEIRKMDSSNPEEDILDLSQIFEPVKQSFSEIVKSSPSKNKEVVKKLVNSGKKFGEKLNDSDIKTPKQIKWESIPKTPYNTRKRSFLSYCHKYPSNQFVNVGVKNTNNNHYSPDEPEDKYDLDIEGNQYKRVANKRKLKNV